MVRKEGKEKRKGEGRGSPRSARARAETSKSDAHQTSLLSALTPGSEENSIDPSAWKEI